MKRIVTISGALLTGAPAIADYLRGSQEGLSFGGNEFDFIRDSGGLYELYCLLYHPSGCFGSSALSRFESYTKYYSNVFYIIAASLGINDKRIPERFMELSNTFISELSEACIDYEFIGNKAFAEEVYKDIKVKTWFECLPDTNIKHKIANFLFKSITWILNGKIIPIAKKTERIPLKSRRIKRNIIEEQFLELSKKYINDIFSILTDKNTIFMVNSFHGEQEKFVNITHKLFSTRDPRDTYCSLQKRLAGTNGITHFGTFTDDTIDDYINMYKALHPNCEGKRLIIRFEDFVLNHEKTTQKICDFIEIDKNKIDRSTYDIEYSKARIGLWESYPNQKVMDKIGTELKDYLYEA